MISILKLFIPIVLSVSPISYYENIESFEAQVDSLPFNIPDEQIFPLRDLVDNDLQKRLEKKLKQNKTWATLIKKKNMAVGIIDLQDPLKPRFARVNGDLMMYAASLPKLAILLAAEQSLEDGTLIETDEVKKDMREMIARSDNGAATRMIDRISMEKIKAVLTNPKYELYDEDKGGGLWVGKRFAKTGRRLGDPLHNISHGATVTQVCRFYYLLSMGKLVNRERSSQMLEYLVDPELHHKFVNTLDILVPDAKIYRKSGTWSRWHSDSALVWGSVWRRYVVVGLVEDIRGERVLRNLIPVVEEVLHNSSK